MGTLKRERAIVSDILGKVPNGRKEQIKLWLERLPDSTERTFDRRKREVKNVIESNWQTGKVAK